MRGRDARKNSVARNGNEGAGRSARTGLSEARRQAVERREPLTTQRAERSHRTERSAATGEAQRPASSPEVAPDPAPTRRENEALSVASDKTPKAPNQKCEKNGDPRSQAWHSGTRAKCRRRAWSGERERRVWRPRRRLAK